MENKNDPKEIEDVILMIKQIPFTKIDGVLMLTSIYDKQKKDSFTTYGKQGGCASLSSSFRTVVQQKKISIKNFLKK